MKKYILLFSPMMSFVLFSCHSNTETGSEQVFKPNTQGVVAETPNANTITNTSDTVGLAAFKASQQKEYEDSLKLVGINEQRAREGKRTLTTLPTNGSSSSSSAQNIETTATTNSGSTTSSSSTTHTTKKKKKGMSNGTKDALIGGGAGALTGALVTKHNRGVGALIGAAAGGGAGYLIGHSKDKKESKQ